MNKDIVESIKLPLFMAALVVLFTVCFSFLPLLKTLWQVPSYNVSHFRLLITLPSLYTTLLILIFQQYNINGLSKKNIITGMVIALLIVFCNALIELLFNKYIKISPYPIGISVGINDIINEFLGSLPPLFILIKLYISVFILYKTIFFAAKYNFIAGKNTVFSNTSLTVAASIFVTNLLILLYPQLSLPINFIIAALKIDPNFNGLLDNIALLFNNLLIFPVIFVFNHKLLSVKKPLIINSWVFMIFLSLLIVTSVHVLAPALGALMSYITDRSSSTIMFTIIISPGVNIFTFILFFALLWRIEPGRFVMAILPYLFVYFMSIFMLLFVNPLANYQGVMRFLNIRMFFLMLNLWVIYISINLSIKLFSKPKLEQSL